jgi:hypothetical protein
MKKSKPKCNMDIYLSNLDSQTKDTNEERIRVFREVFLYIMKRYENS